MKKKLSDEIGKAFIRLHCSHWYWHRESPLEMGSLSRGIIVCNNCGKRKFIEQLKDSEVLVELQRYKDIILQPQESEDKDEDSN